MPREPVDRQRIESFLRELGKRFRRPGRVYLVGGTTMVYEGFRAQTLDIDEGGATSCRTQRRSSCSKVH